MQLKILLRGLELLGPGGRLLYSTCSLNPVEDEAVVAAALERYRGGNVHLVALPAAHGLVYTPGLQQWGVPAKSFSAENPVLYNSIEEATGGALPVDDACKPPDEAGEVAAAGKRPPKKQVFPPSMFPPRIAEVASQLHLCGRVLPMHSNGGGFFLALFEKAGKANATEAELDGDPAEHNGSHDVHEPASDRLHEEEQAARMFTPPARSASVPSQVESTNSNGALGSMSAPRDKDKDQPVLRPLLKAAPESVVDVLVSQFGLKDGDFPVSTLFVRGDNLILASHALSRIWCTAKGLQVLEAGQYLFSGVREKGFEEWRIYPEAAWSLGRFAHRRLLSINPKELEQLLSDQASHRN
eukprot:TRINITY_DN77646_c0_g1_i1.p1 TRINITY_DN77646_c0_g1~~TRINITY_DN77646_c0_g1_i1.p1  ORF type:complete len:406 (-),score=78.17 TRINITY_DN77646_c0_g1_i1:181-1245(-)